MGATVTAVDTVMAVDMVAMAVDTATTARGKLMLSPRLRLSPATAMVAMAGAMAAMAATGVDITARGLLMLSLRPMLLLRLATAMAAMAMVATVEVMAVTDTARGLLSPAMAMAVMA